MDLETAGLADSLIKPWKGNIYAVGGDLRLLFKEGATTFMNNARLIFLIIPQQYSPQFRLRRERLRQFYICPI